MKKLTLLAATAVAVVVAADASAAEKPAPAKKAKPAAADKSDAKPAAPADAPAADAPKPMAIKDPVAVVDGENILIADVEKVVERMVAQKGGSLKDIPPEMKPQLYRQVIEGVIVEKLVTKKAAAIEVTDADVSAEYDRFKGQFPDEKTMTEQLAGQGQTPEGLKGEIKNFIRQNRWIDDQLKGKIEVTDADAEKFYKENQEQFKQPEQVRASHILVKVEKDAKDEEVKTKLAEANKILGRVKKGEDFDKLATELSEDPSAKENHGDLNFFPKDQMVPEFSDAAFKMKKGDISAEPVRSDFGFHIIKVTDRKDASTMSLDETKPKVLDYLKQQKRQGEIGKVLKELRDGAKVTVNLPEVAPKFPAGDAPPAPAEAPAK